MAVRDEMLALTGGQQASHRPCFPPAAHLGSLTWDSTYRASATSNNTVEGQSIWNTKGDGARVIRVDGGASNGFPLLISNDRGPGRVDMGRATVGKRVNHGGACGDFDIQMGDL